MSRYVAVGGVQVAAVGLQWAAFSPLSGETHLINNECAAILEVVMATDGVDSARVARALAEDTGLPVDELMASVDEVWPALVGSGLVRDTQTAVPRAA